MCIRDRFIMKYILDDKPYKTIHDKNIAAINWIAHETNSSLYIVNSETALFEFPNPDPWPVARDGNHPGPAWNDWVSKKVLKDLSNEIY